MVIAIIKTENDDLIQKSKFIHYLFYIHDTSYYFMITIAN